MSLSLRGKRHGPEKRKRGWVAPGYNYLGPGNDMGMVPVDEDDRIAQDHDERYTKYQKYGHDPYWNWNEADEVARNEFGHGYGGWIGKGAFTLKRTAYQAGLIGSIPEPRPEEDRIAEVFGGHSHISPKHNKRIVRNQRKMPSPNQSEEWKKLQEEIARKKKEEEQKRINDPLNRPTQPMNEDKNKGPPPTVDDPMTGPSSSLRLAGGGAVGNHGETGIDAWRNARLNPFNKTQNTILPYYQKAQGTLQAVDTEGGQFSFTIRLNSIYDILTTRSYTANPAEAADAADGTIQVPIMRNFWIQLYDYWTVVDMHYKVRFWSEDEGFQEIEIFEYKHGMQAPPSVNANGTSGGLLWRKYRMMHPHMRYKTFRLRNAASTEQDPFDKTCEFTGHYNYNMTYNAVAEDELAQTWHKETEVPPQREQLTYIIQRSERSPFSTQTIIKYDIEAVYHVQWKDLKAVMEYPYPAGSITFSTFQIQGN